MFSTVKYRAIDYCFEATVKHKLMMNLLMLPVPVTLAMPCPEKAYRTPWAYGSLRSSCRLEVSGCALDDLKSELRLVESLERYEVRVADLEGVAVPSSNPTSQRCVASQEALWLLHGGQSPAEPDGCIETFSLADLRSALLGYQGLYLPEEVIISDNRLKRNLPSLLTLVKKLQTIPVSDPLELHQTGSFLSHRLSFSLYEASPISSSSSSSAVIEEFRKETILDAQCLMLPVGIETTALQKQELITSVNKLQEALTLAPEPAQDQTPVLETLERASALAGELNPSQCESFSAPAFDLDVPQKANSPHPFASCVALETDVIVSPPNQPARPELCPSGDHLSAEPLSPGYKQCFLPDPECEILEKAVWTAEKHHQSVSGYLLTEPLISEPSAGRPSLTSELLALMKAERCHPLSLATPLNPALMPVLTVEAHSAAERRQTKTVVMEEFRVITLSELGAEAASSVSAGALKRKTVRFKLNRAQKRRLKLKANKRDSVQPERKRKRSVNEAKRTLCDAPDDLNEAVARSIRMQSSAAAQRELPASVCPASGTSGVPESSLAPQKPKGSGRVTSADPQPAQSAQNKTTTRDRASAGTPGVFIHANGAAHSCFMRERSNPAGVEPTASLTPVSNPASRGRPADNAPPRHSDHTARRGAPSSSEGVPVQAARPSWSGDAHKVAAPSPFASFASRKPGTTPRTPHKGQESVTTSLSGSGAGDGRGTASVIRRLDVTDPLSSFMMLRGFQRSQATPRLDVTETAPQLESSCHPVASGQCHSSARAAVAHSQKSVPQTQLDSGATLSRRVSRAAQSGIRVPETPSCSIIRVKATDTQRGAYRELQALARPALRRAQASGSTVLRGAEFGGLTSERTRFSLKQQEKLLRTGQGQVKEKDYKDVALLHILVTVKEMLLRCDLNAAADYLAEACFTCDIEGLKGLLRKFQVLQHLSSKWAEPSPRVQAVLEQVSRWLHRNWKSKVLVVTAVESERAELVTALRQIPGNTVTTIPSTQCGRVERGTLADCRCAVVCVQQVGAEFPWWMFRAVLELQGLNLSPVEGVCAKNKLTYTCITTATPDTDSPLIGSPLDRVPFLLFITDGLLKRSDLLQLLESTYNMTLLERSHPPSLRALGGTHLYDVITVDENTAVLLQEMGELDQDGVAEGVILRLLCLSLQFSRCWVLLYCLDHHSALVRGSVFTNLALIYSGLVIFGSKSDGLDVKVLLVCDAAAVARSVYQICLHTLLSSERDVNSWLDRHRCSVLLTQEEEFLLRFPCVNSVTAQLMITRAPTLQCLLEASREQLEETFPELKSTVCELFSNCTAALAVATHSEPHVLPWGLDQDTPQTSTHSDPFSGFGCSDTLQSYTGCFPEDEDPWTPLASSPLNPDFAHTHTDAFSATFAPFAQHPPAPQLTYPHHGMCAHSTFPSTSPFLPTQAQQQWCPSGTEMFSSAGRKRPAGGVMHTMFPQYKRGRLLCEKVPGRTDGQTRLRFF